MIETVEVAAEELSAPSLTTHEMVRLAVGFSALEEKVTERSAV